MPLVPDLDPLRDRATPRRGVSIWVLGLTNRYRIALFEAGLLTVGEVARASVKDLIAIPGIGPSGVVEAREKLRAYLECQALPPSPISREVPPAGAPPVPAESTEEQASPQPAVVLGQQASDDTPIQVLGLPIRAQNALIRNGAKTVGELLALSEEQLLEFRNLGRMYLGELHRRLKAYQVGELSPLVVEAKPAEVDQPPPPSELSLPDGPIELLWLSRRSYNALYYRSGISTIAEVAAKSEEELLTIPLGRGEVVVDGPDECGVLKAPL